MARIRIKCAIYQGANDKFQTVVVDGRSINIPHSATHMVKRNGEDSEIEIDAWLARKEGLQGVVINDNSRTHVEATDDRFHRKGQR